MPISINHIVKSYSPDFNFSIKELLINDGQKVIITGKNGSGKTTFLHLLLNLVKPDAGDICIDNDKINTCEKWKNYTSSYLNETFLFDFLTPKEFFNLILKLKNHTVEIDKLVSRLNLEIFIKDVYHSKKIIRDLSSGNKQKVGLAAAFLTLPKLLILDEPFNYLDTDAAKQLTTVLNADIFSTSTVILSVHNQESIFQKSMRKIIFDNGQISSDTINY